MLGAGGGTAKGLTPTAAAGCTGYCSVSCRNWFARSSSCCVGTTSCGARSYVTVRLSRILVGTRFSLTKSSGGIWYHGVGIGWLTVSVSKPGLIKPNLARAVVGEVDRAGRRADLLVVDVHQRTGRIGPHVEPPPHAAAAAAPGPRPARRTPRGQPSAAADAAMCWQPGPWTSPWDACPSKRCPSRLRTANDEGAKYRNRPPSQPVRIDAQPPRGRAGAVSVPAPAG